MFKALQTACLTGALLGTVASALPTFGLSARDGVPVVKINKITCVESANQVPTALCARDPSQTVKAPVVADCMKLADSWLRTPDLQSNSYGYFLGDAVGKCKITITNGNDASAAGGLMTVQYDPKAVGQWIKDQAAACFERPEFNMAQCSMLDPIGQLKLWSGDA